MANLLDRKTALERLEVIFQDLLELHKDYPQSNLMGDNDELYRKREELRE